jgi:hypothetical protein
VEAKQLEQNILALVRRPTSSREIRIALGFGEKRSDQRLDRALQRLRKEGKLKLHAGRWAPVEVQMCSCCHGKGWVMH